MKVKMLWRKMTVGMAIALMLAMSLGTLETAAEMIGEDMIATQAEDTIWEDEIDLSGDETANLYALSSCIYDIGKFPFTIVLDVKSNVY